jgi:nucleotide-binding universal stress UspA family protein
MAWQSMAASPKILHSTDFSETSDRALRKAIDYAKLHHAPIDLVHVERPIAGALRQGSPPSERKESYVSHSLEQRARLIREAGVRCETFALLGTPGSAILDHAKQRGITLIVMGTHGRTGIGRALMGSVTQHVARYSNCPVLIVAPKE